MNKELVTWNVEFSLLAYAPEDGDAPPYEVEKNSINIKAPRAENWQELRSDFNTYLVHNNEMIKKLLPGIRGEFEIHNAYIISEEESQEQ